MSKYLIVSKVAKETGISTNTLARWCRMGKILGARQTDIVIGMGRIWEIPASQVASLKAEPDGKRAAKYGKGKQSALLTS